MRCVVMFVMMFMMVAVRVIVVVTVVGFLIMRMLAANHMRRDVMMKYA